jgi:EAL domain-containing protein (putative c-di-GMP-specific phosphodiesterase class I)
MGKNPNKTVLLIENDAEQARIIRVMITTVPGATAAVEAFMDMGRGLRLQVIAQGVETAEDLEFLWAHDCDEAQGNFFGPPVPPSQLAKLLRPN